MNENQDALTPEEAERRAEKKRELTEYRDTRGRFVRGNPGGPGRKRGSHRETFYRWAETQFNGWLARAQKMAEEDPQMLRFLMEQYMGKAQQSVDVTQHVDPPAVKALEEMQQKLRRVK